MSECKLSKEDEKFMKEISEDLRKEDEIKKRENIKQGVFEYIRKIYTKGNDIIKLQTVGKMVQLDVTKCRKDDIVKHFNNLKVEDLDSILEELEQEGHIKHTKDNGTSYYVVAF